MVRSRGSASGKGEREGALSPFFVQGNLEKKISPKGKNPLGEILLLANVVFVNRGIVVVLYQIDGVDVLVKDAGVDELLDVRVQEKFDAGSAGGTQLSRNGHQHRFLAGLSELAGKVHRRKVGEKGRDVGHVTILFSV